MSKAAAKRLVGTAPRLLAFLAALAGVLLLVIGSIVFWECLTRVPTRRAAPELEQARLGLSRPVALDPELTRRIASVEIRGTKEVTFCGKREASRPVATIDVVASASSKGASSPANRKVEADLDVPELKLGSEKPWTLEIKVIEQNQITLLAKSAEPVSIEFYARPHAMFDERPCDGRIPAQARGEAVTLVVHLRASEPGDEAKWPNAKLFGELWPTSFAGVLKAGTRMTLMLTRFRSCSFDTENREYDHFELASTATCPTLERPRNAPPDRGEIAVRSLSLAAAGLVTSLEWDEDTTWGDSGYCSCRCTEEAKAPLEVGAQ